MTRIVYLTGPEGSIDETFQKDLQDEGFIVNLLPLGDDRRAYAAKLRNLVDDLELDEKYAVVAFDGAAAECLETYIDPNPQLAALIAYYPNEIRSPTHQYENRTKLVVHLTTSQPFSPAFDTFKYDGVEPGFASRGSGKYDIGAASLAWYRTVSTLRSVFGIRSSVQRVYRDYHSAKYIEQEVPLVMELLHDDASIFSDPNCQGGETKEELHDYFESYVICGLPESLSIEIKAQTIGADTIVNELELKFEHTKQMPWILPAAVPTNRQVAITVVSIVQVRGSKVFQERLYWNQAAVLQQCGLAGLGLTYSKTSGSTSGHVSQADADEVDIPMRGR